MRYSAEQLQMNTIFMCVYANNVHDVHCPHRHSDQSNHNIACIIYKYRCISSFRHRCHLLLALSALSLSLFHAVFFQHKSHKAHKQLDDRNDILRWLSCEVKMFDGQLLPKMRANNAEFMKKIFICWTNFNVSFHWFYNVILW